MRRFVWFVLVIATLVASDCPFPTYGPGCTQHCQQDAYGTYCPDNSYRCEPHVGCSCDLLYGPYWGVNCNVPCNCNNRATACGQYTGDCACIDSWGTSCEYSCPSYNGNICNSKGTCVGQGTNANGTCACNKWISGDACQIGVTHTKTKSRSCGSPSSTVGRTASRTVSLSPTNTRAASPTASAAASLTLSASLSLTLSISSRNTATASLTNPRTMATLSPSSTRSSSAASRTSDGTLSRTVTPPPTKTRSSTGPRTPSTTPTALESVTPTTSVSVSTTGTDTRSSSSEGTPTRRTISLTDTATVTHAVTPPKKRTRTRTRLQTVSGTSHPSRSVTPTSSAELPTSTPTFSSERTPTVSDTRSAVYHLSVSVIVEAACNAVVDVVCWTDSPSSSTRGGALSVVLLQSAAAGGSDWTAATIQDSFPPNVAPLAQHSNATSNITSITRVVVQGKTIVNATNPLVTSGAVVVTLLAECPPIPNGLPSTPPAITASPESHNLAGTHMMGGVAAATSLMSGPDLLSSPIVWRSLIAIGVAALMGVCFALL